MEVDQLKRKSPCVRCGRFHSTTQCFKHKETMNIERSNKQNTIRTRQPNQQANKQTNLHDPRFRSRRTITCYNCGKRGHVQAECWENPNRNKIHLN